MFNWLGGGAFFAGGLLYYLQSCMNANLLGQEKFKKALQKALEAQKIALDTSAKGPMGTPVYKFEIRNDADEKARQSGAQPEAQSTKPAHPPSPLPSGPSAPVVQPPAPIPTPAPAAIVSRPTSPTQPDLVLHKGDGKAQVDADEKARQSGAQPEAQSTEHARSPAPLPSGPSAPAVQPQTPMPTLVQTTSTAPAPILVLPAPPEPLSESDVKTQLNTGEKARRPRAQSPDVRPARSPSPLPLESSAPVVQPPAPIPTPAPAAIVPRPTSPTQPDLVLHEGDGKAQVDADEKARRSRAQSPDVRPARSPSPLPSRPSSSVVRPSSPTPTPVQTTSTATAPILPRPASPPHTQPAPVPSESDAKSDDWRGKLQAITTPAAMFQWMQSSKGLCTVEMSQEIETAVLKVLGSELSVEDSSIRDIHRSLDDFLLAVKNHKINKKKINRKIKEKSQQMYPLCTQEGDRLYKQLTGAILQTDQQEFNQSVSHMRVILSNIEFYEMHSQTGNENASILTENLEAITQKRDKIEATLSQYRYAIRRIDVALGDLESRQANNMPDRPTATIMPIEDLFKTLKNYIALYSKMNLDTEQEKLNGNALHARFLRACGKIRVTEDVVARLEQEWQQPFEN